MNEPRPNVPGVLDITGASRVQDDRELARPQAAQLCQVSEEILDQWSCEPGFPVIRRNGGHFVRIHRAALEGWLEQLALGANPRPLYSDEPPAPVRPPGSALTPPRRGFHVQRVCAVHATAR